MKIRFQIRIMSSFFLSIFSILAMVWLPTSIATAETNDQAIEITVEGKADMQPGNPAGARADALANALEQGSEQAVERFIGPSKAERYKPLLKQKIYSQSNKFISSYKASEPKVMAGHVYVTTTMRIAMDSLRALLNSEQLLSDTSGPYLVIPAVRVQAQTPDQKNWTLAWWMNSAADVPAPLQTAFKGLLKATESNLRAKDFDIIDPISRHYGQLVPAPFRHDTLTEDDYVWFGEYFKASLLLTGDMNFHTANDGSVVLETNLRAYHTGNGRMVAEVTRTFTSTATDFWSAVRDLTQQGTSELSKDLGSQIIDEFNRGVLGATSLRLTLSGNLTPADIEGFRQQVPLKVSDVRLIRERYITHGAVTFEVDAQTDPQSLSQKIAQASYDGFTVKSQGINGTEMRFRFVHVSGH